MNAQQLREAILSQRTLRRQEVHCPEWGVTFFIREMTGTERDEWDQSLTRGNGKVDISNIRARLVAQCAVDTEGNRIFSMADAVALGQVSAKALDRCAKVAQKVNGLTEDDLEDAKGNSSGVPSADSTSNSPATSGE